MDSRRIIRLKKIEAELQAWDFPPQLIVENTSRCNMQCIHCNHKELIRKKGHMARAIWDKVVAELAVENPQTELWPTFYGEALILGDELWDRIDFASRVGCKNLVLNSNGTLLEHKNNLERILDSPLKRFILSLDGFSKEVLEKIRYLGNRDDIYGQVEALLRRKAQRRQRYPAIICQFSVMDENRHEVEQFSHYWRARGAEVKVRPMLEWTASGSVNCYEIDHESAFRIACPWGNNTMAIHANGDVVACACDYEGHFKVGNVEDFTVKELWQRLGEQLRGPHLRHEWGKIPTVCQGCGDWQVAGAEYDEVVSPDTRPFWYKAGSAEVTYSE